MLNKGSGRGLVATLALTRNICASLPLVVGPASKTVAVEHDQSRHQASLRVRSAGCMTRCGSRKTSAASDCRDDEATAGRTSRVQSVTCKLYQCALASVASISRMFQGNERHCSWTWRRFIIASWLLSRANARRASL